MKSSIKKEECLVYSEDAEYTQKALNKILPDCNLVVDGLSGKETCKALTRLAVCLGDAFETNRYSIEEGVNLVGLRVSDKFTNRFTDFYICWDWEEFSNTRVFPCSTKSGLPRVLAPKWVMGKYGVATLKEGQYKNAFSLQGGWWSGLPFLYQIRPVTVYRDGNKNALVDRTGEQAGLFGINHHSWIGFKGKILGNLSEGCQVFKPEILGKILPYWERASQEQGEGITYTLLHVNDLDL